MAQDYVVLKNTSEHGKIAMNKSVFQSICEITLQDAENISTTGRMSKPLKVSIVDNQLHVSVDIRVKYGANVNATCSLVQSKIYENIVFMTGFKPADVTVNVTGFDIVE